MKDKKVFCRRAEELKSINELGLSESVINFLKKDKRPIGAIIAAARLERDCENSCIGLLFSDKACSSLSNADRVYDYRDEIVQALEEKGYIRYDLRPARRILSICELFDPLDDWYYEGVDDGKNFYRDGYKLVNRKYESFDFSEDKLIEVFKILERWLTKDQYEIMKFDILISANIGVNETYYYSDNEKSLLEAAWKNTSHYFRKEILECILS